MYHDVSLPISRQLLVWPGDPSVELRAVASLARGDQFNVSALCLGTHTGTHLDAPRHMFETGETVDRLPLEILMGEAWVCNVPAEVRQITAEVLVNSGIPADVRRLLLKTANSSLWDLPTWDHSPDFVALSADAAQWIADRSIDLVGIDYLSIDPPDTSEAHRVLLSRGVVIVEGLDLRRVSAGAYQLFCLPLRLAGADGAPARVVLSGSD